MSSYTGIRKRSSVLLAHRHFVLLVMIGLFIRVAILLSTTELPYIGDAGSYASYAQQLLLGSLEVPYFPPGVSLYLLPFFTLFGTTVFVSSFAMLPVWIVFILLLYDISARLTSKRTALIITGIFTVYPEYIYHSVTPLSHLLTATLILLLLRIALSAQRVSLNARRDRFTMLIFSLGFFLGITVLVRPSALIIGIPILISILLKHRSWKVIIIPVAITLTIIFAWNLMVFESTSKSVFINTANSYNFFMGNNEFTPLYRTWFLSWEENYRPLDYLSQLEQVGNDYSDAALKHIIERPELFLARTLNRIRVFWGFDTFTAQVFGFGYGYSRAISLAIILANALCWSLVAITAIQTIATLPKLQSLQRDSVALSSAITLCYAASVWLVFSHPNYRFAVTPLVALISAFSIERFIKEMSNLPNESTWDKFNSQLRLILSNRTFVVMLMLFTYIQIEWAITVYTFEILNPGYSAW